MELSMQDQTSSQSSLQQPRADLQQSTPNLQQGGSPTSAANTTTTLNQLPATSQLRVQTLQGQGTISPPATSNTEPNGGSSALLLLLLLIPIALATALFMPRKRTVEPQIEQVEQPVITQPLVPKPKSKKKSTKRKKSSKR